MIRLEETGYLEIEKEFIDRKPHTVLHLTTEGRDAFDEYRKKMSQVFGGLTD